MHRDVGTGSVTLFIIPGVGLCGAEWWPLQDRMGEFARVITWDRPGCGDSGPHTSPRTTANIAHEALEVLGTFDGPIVLLGHSQGGLYANAIARLAASRVRGVVLLDPAHPDNSRLRRELPAKILRRSGSDLAARFTMARRFARLRLAGLFKSAMVKPYRAHDAETVENIWRHLQRTQTYDTALAEYHELEHGKPDLDQFGPFPDIPVTTLVHDPDAMIELIGRRLSHEDAQRVETLWGELLRDTTYTREDARTVTVTGAGHTIHLDEPDVVLEAVRTVALAAQPGPSASG